MVLGRISGVKSPAAQGQGKGGWPYMPRWHIFFLKGETLRDECLLAYTTFKILQIERVEAPFHIAEYHLPLVSRWDGGKFKDVATKC